MCPDHHRCLYKGTEQTIGLKATETPWLGKPNQWNPPQEKAPKLASKPDKPPPNTHLALNTRWHNPSQATDKPCPGELHHKTIHHPHFGAFFSNGGQPQQKKSSERGTGIPTNKRNERAKIKGRQRKEQKKNKIEKNKQKTKHRQKKPYLVGLHNFCLLFLPDRFQMVERQCLL